MSLPSRQAGSDTRVGPDRSPRRQVRTRPQDLIQTQAQVGPRPAPRTWPRPGPKTRLRSAGPQRRPGLGPELGPSWARTRTQAQDPARSSWTRTQAPAGPAPARVGPARSRRRRARTGQTAGPHLHPRPDLDPPARSAAQTGWNKQSRHQPPSGAKPGLVQPVGKHLFTDRACKTSKFVQTTTLKMSGKGCRKPDLTDK